MKIWRTIGWMLALETIVPGALAGQTVHNLSKDDHVRIQYAVGMQGGQVEGDVERLTPDSLGLALEDHQSLTLAWDDVLAASVWTVQKPEHYIGGLMGGVFGALVGGFVAVNRSQNRPVGNELSGWTVGKGAAIGAAGGALLGVGVSELFKPHGWRRVNVHTQVAAAPGAPPRVGFGLSLKLGW